MGWDGIHWIIDIKSSHRPSEKLLQKWPKRSNQQRCPRLHIMAAWADAHIADNEPIHASNEVKDFRLWFPETNEAIEDSRNGARQNRIHGNFLRNDIHGQTYLVLSKRHIDEDIPNENEQNAKYSKRQCFWIVVEILSDVHVIESDERIKVLLFDLDMSQLLDFHH